MKKVFSDIKNILALFIIGCTMIFYMGVTFLEIKPDPDIKTIDSQSLVGSGNVDLTKSDVGLSNVDNTSDATKNVLSTTKLTTARTINGVSFDGTSNITVADNTKEPIITAGGGSISYILGQETLF